MSFSSPLFIFLLSLACSLVSFFCLRLIGIDWDYHVDAVTYIESSSSVANAIYNGSSPLNLGYFLVVDLLSSNPLFVSLLNIILFSFSNALISRLFRKFSFPSSSRLLLSIIFYFNPYRIYLSTTVLKDTLVIFLSLLTFLSFFNTPVFRKFISLRSLFSFIALLAVRLQSISYLLLSLRIKPSVKNTLLLITVSFSLFFLLQSYLQTSIIDVIKGSSTVDMSFRIYDTVPNFSSLGFTGSLLRMLIWPIFVSTGLFFVFSPSFEFFFVCLGSFFFFISIVLTLRKYYITTYSYLLLSLTASVTTGFTSYVRYALPIQCISFLLVLAFCSFQSKRISSHILPEQQ